MIAVKTKLAQSFLKSEAFFGHHFESVDYNLMRKHFVAQERLSCQRRVQGLFCEQSLTNHDSAQWQLHPFGHLQ